MSSPSKAQIARLRAMAQRHLRTWLYEEGLMEVNTPLAVPNPGMEPTLRAFALNPVEAHSHAGRYLHTSPELAIKSTLAELGEDVYSFGPVFRDEPCSRVHHPEFTMLEWYRLDADLERLKIDVERMVRRLAHACAVFGSGRDPFHGSFQNFGSMSVSQAFEEQLGLDVFDFNTERWVEAAQKRSISVEPTWDRDTLFSVLYSEAIEPALGAHGPIFLERYPIEDAALSAPDPSDPRVALRMEFYLPFEEHGKTRGLEIANAFQELLDPIVQRQRFEEFNEQRLTRGLTELPIPERMLAKIEKLPPTAGIALGWDRLLLWLAQRCLGWELRVSDLFVGELRPLD